MLFGLVCDHQVKSNVVKVLSYVRPDVCLRVICRYITKTSETRITRVNTELFEMLYHLIAKTSGVCPLNLNLLNVHSYLGMVVSFLNKAL